jgi:pSer/pThr/pTyr-binding forkhead associated (FHA) protein
MSVILKPTQGGRPVVVDKPIMLIGRHPDCDIIIKESPKISRKHCCLALVDNRFVIRDLDSMNGVWVNGDRVVHSSDVRPGDELTVGDVAFELVNHGAGKDTPKQAPRQQPPPRPKKVNDDSHDSSDKSVEGATDSSAGKAMQLDPNAPLPFSLDIESGEDSFIPLADVPD